MEKDKLINAVKSLNAAVYEDEANEQKSPVLAVKIKTVAVKIEALQAAFINACQNIPEELEEFVPPEVVDAYNELVPNGGEAAPAQQDATVEPVAAKKKKEKKAPDTTTEPKEKKASNLPAREKDSMGNVVGSMSSRINDFLIKGAKEEVIIAALVSEFGKENDMAVKKLKRKIRKLGAAGINVSTANGLLKIIPKA